ncbi:MAG: TetR/AcrR family transcriptional regulator [Bacilli bacterium]
MGKSIQIIQTKQKILNTLALLLEKKSYDDITIGEISKLSKISRTTIYRHFENKDEIASEFIKNIFDFSSSSENIPFNELLR